MTLEDLAHERRLLPSQPFMQLLQHGGTVPGQGDGEDGAHGGTFGQGILTLVGVRRRRQVIIPPPGFRRQWPAARAGYGLMWISLVISVVSRSMAETEQ